MIVRLLDKLAWGIATDPSIETRDLDLAEKIAKQGNEAAKGQDPSTLDTLARLSFMRGNKDAAVSLEEQSHQKSPPTTRSRTNFSKPSLPTRRANCPRPQ